MANTEFYVPRLVKEGAWLDWRGRHRGGNVMYGDRALSEIRYFAAHHSVTNPTGNAGRDVDTLANIHINGNGWAGIGYNFVITSEEVNGFAKVAYVGDLGTVRAHTPNSKGAFGLAKNLGNRYIVAACIIGQNHIHNPSEAQKRSMKLLAQELLWFEDQRIPNLWNTWDDFRCHYNFDYTQCNGMTHIRQAIIDTVIPAEATPAPVPTPPPVVIPPEDKPIVRALGALLTVKVGQGDKVVNVLTGAVTKEYTKDEPFEATHTAEYKGKKYYMTSWNYQQYEKGKAPTGVDVSTVDAWVTIPEVPETPPELPPHTDPKPPVDEDLKKEHDEIVKEIERNRNILTKILGLLEDLVNLFKGVFK